MSYRDTAAVEQLFAPAIAERPTGRSDSEQARHLCRQLEIAGVGHTLLHRGAQVFVPGATLAFSATSGIVSDAAAAQLHEQAFAILARGLRVSVLLTGLEAIDDAAQSLRSLCAALTSAAQDASVATSNIEIAIEADALSPQEAWLLCSNALGYGRVYLIADGERMSPTGGSSTREQCEQFWLQLWHLRNASAMRTACASVVSSRCPLLSAEHASSVLPLSGVQAPVGTAWLPLQIDLTRFSNARGCIHMKALENALHCSVDIGDVLHDLIEWPTATMRHDAWLNRRMAISITGLGDLALQRRLDPQSAHGLRNLAELLQWVQQTVHARSQQLARIAGHLPALDLTDPARSLPSGAIRDDWRRRWLQAVEQGAVRHRNLLALSPWSVFPSRSPADPRYAELLPLLAFGDACVFTRPTKLTHWNINEFKSFHQRAWATLLQRDAAALIAERV